MAAILTIVAVIGGVGLGVAKGGTVHNALGWRPVWWEAAVGALALELIIKLGGMSGWFAVTLDILAMLALLLFAVSNLRVGGMVLIAVGLALNLAPTILNWGMPVSASALETAGLVSHAKLSTVELAGPRHVDHGDDTLGFLGEIIPVPPTSQVISLGDLVLHAGYVLVIASVLRRRVVRPHERDARRAAPRRGGSRSRSAPRSGAARTRTPGSRATATGSARSRAGDPGSRSGSARSGTSRTVTVRNRGPQPVDDAGRTVLPVRPVRPGRPDERIPGRGGRSDTTYTSR